MPNVYWSDEARTTFDDLSPEAQRAIIERLDLLRQFPALYALVETGRYRGLRRFTVLRRYLVFYRVIGEAQHCFVRAIRPARRRPE